MAGILDMKKSYGSTITGVIPFVVTCAVDHIPYMQIMAVDRIVWVHSQYH